ncbi:STAS domain-containing protein [Streptacidiphilus monticola]|uniref:Anti-sigma factor antagonist n=1 Tax=Streptacidiphilus monticola TaxID=2161674 RepID=A0ABW1G4A0_9ACTN
MSSTTETSSTEEPGRFAVAESDQDESVVLALRGELDHDTAPALRDALERSMALIDGRPGGTGAGAGRIVVDCTELRFCDSTGLNLLLKARMTVRDRGGALALAGMRPQVARVFEITGADSVFPTFASLEEALGSGGAR